MNSPDVDTLGRLKRHLIGVGAAISLLFCAGVIAGLLSAHQEHGGGLISPFMAGILLGVILAMTLLVYVTYRQFRWLFGKQADLTKKERLNRNIMILCLIIGLLMGVLLAVLDPDYTIIADSNIPAAAAIILAIFWAVAMPILAYVWHKRAIDEQEAAAYRDGAYYAAYAFVIGAPTWWILARGGLVPQINDVVIFTIFNFIWLGVWFYKKYR